MVHYGKFGNHLPLNRQSDDVIREGIPLDELIRHNVFADERVHGDDTTVPVDDGRHRPGLDQWPRRTPFRRASAAGRLILLFDQSGERAP